MFKQDFGEAAIKCLCLDEELKLTQKNTISPEPEQVLPWAYFYSHQSAWPLQGPLMILPTAPGPMLGLY